MADFQYIEFKYPVQHIFEKILFWITINSGELRCYFALKNLDGDDWIYYACAEGSHALATGLKLTSWGNAESSAQSNYFLAGSDRNIAVLPALLEARYVRIYIDADAGQVELHEFHPSTKFLADEIITGTFRITDDFLASPSIQMVKGGQERIYVGDLGDDVYGWRGRNSSGDIILELSSEEDNPFVSNYADHTAIELELMKMNFQYISWAQFAIYDALDNELKRADPDLSANDARVYRSRIDNGDDATANREFGFVSKIYTDITTVETGTSTDVGLNYLEDTGKSWFDDEIKNLTLIDSGANEFNIDAWDLATHIMTVVGTPAAGAYSLRDDTPQYAVAFCSYLDSTNGGSGYVKMEVSFDNGVNYQIFLDTENSVDHLRGTYGITHPGDDFIARLTLKNDDSGSGAMIYKFLVCTDPSPWRF